MSGDHSRLPAPDARAIVARLGREAAALLGRELLAPAVPGGRIRTRLGGLVYEFRLRGRFSGWGRFRPLSEREVEPVGEALPWERSAYLELFPALRVILLWPDPEPDRPGAWWALPYNESDVRQRFGLPGEPVLVHLCDPLDGAQGFERVIVRVDGSAYWYDRPDPLSDPAQAEWLREAAATEQSPDRWMPGLSGSQRLSLLYSQVRRLDAGLREERLRGLRTRNRAPWEQAQWLRQAALADRLQEGVRHALAKADAVLHSCSETTNPDGSPGPLLVEWSERGHTYRYRSLLDPALTVVSSGICLSGRDREFDLTSLVSVIGGRPEWMEEEDL